jgi:hypothetical protein
MCKQVSPLLLSTYLAGCAIPPVLPTLSLRALSVLHERATTTVHARTLDVALSLQISGQYGRRIRAVPATWNVPATENVASLPGAPCSDEALCQWESAAEQTALYSLGVAP